MTIDAYNLDFAELNDIIRKSGRDCHVKNCLGQRFIAAGMNQKDIVIDGIPGNALGAYLAGADITVNGNAQDAVGDTMNSGIIVIHGNTGDAAGYAMRGGEIYINGSAGYRAGVHMKEYEEKKPVIVIGNRAGSFLGEYQAGGLIIVLGINTENKPIVGNFPCTGMHGGKMIIRGAVDSISFPTQVSVRKAEGDDINEITPYINRFCDNFGYDAGAFLKDTFTVVSPDSKNPYKQMYVAN